MKKYLMTIAAAAMCAAFTSCSHDFDSMSQEELNNLEAEQIVNNYNQAFIKTFGQPAANQDWGFGTNATRSVTRAGTPRCDVEGKTWADEFKSVASPITPEERAAVIEEFSKVHNDLGETVNWTNYYVQQVYSCKNQDANKYTTFRDQNGYTQTRNAWEQMDKVVCGTFDVHANNFNANQDPGKVEVWDGKTYRADGQKQTYYDEIQLIRDCNTQRFGYHNSLDSKYHYEYIILKVNGAYYVGFDFCASYSFNTRTSDGGFIKDNYEQDPGTDGDTNFNGYTLRSNDEVKWNADQTIKGYLGGEKDVHRDHIYNDWIIKISPAEEKISEDYDVRIIAEDLNATAEEKSDWDFNDVVFDVKFTSDDAAEVTLIAAGGTLPLIVGVNNPDDNEDYYENEVHYLFGVPVNYMVNTNAEAKNLNGGAPENAAPKLNLTIPGVKASNGKLIPIHVKKSLKGGGKHWFELTAEKGHPASKLAVNSKSSKFTICDEREYILTRYPNFLNWVVNNDPLIWWE